ncbi:adenosine deaminase (plasmid) [Legionella adelaidensis]|uniref:Adenosine deaminase n=1 Tax=Legionella adelaidensis TaxID=45056 RepID=A0A0W0R0A1_9GAMM|nr:adenosine deaminase [Legionella adelaidensis]KTC64499.1 adenosine deaminase [Legionella adelaidensis]VEH85867.1 adenosine deaminase [Legionella adelaidensis]
MPIKKAELHVHLEGTISPTLAKMLAKRNKLQIPPGLISEDGTSYLYRDFLHFLKVYDTLADLIKTPEDYYDVTFEYLKELALEDTIYVEMMYSPDHAEKTTGAPSINNLEAIQKAIDDAQEKHDIVGRIILTAVRHFGQDASIRVVKEASKKLVPCVTGFGLGGDEINFPPKLFKRAYQMANDLGLECTVHAGEFAPASGMIEAMENLPIKRIGHGVQSIYSPEAVAMVKDRDIALEVCPSSNIQLGLFKNFTEHPFPKFLEEGVKISIGSDDPPFMSTTLPEEYKRVQKAYQYDDATMNRITEMAIDYAFVDEQTKKKLKEKINN